MRIVGIHRLHAAVDDGFLLGVDPVRVKLLEQRQHKLRFVNDGIAAVAVTLYHIQRIDMIGAAGSDSYGFRSQDFAERYIFPFRVAD